MERLEAFKHKAYKLKTYLNASEALLTLAKIRHDRVQHEIEKPVFWTVIIDGTTDISKTDQVALLIRYVNMNYPEILVKIKESFINFCNLSDNIAQGYVQGLHGSFNKYHLNTIHLVVKYMMEPA